MPQPRFQISSADNFGAPGVYVRVNSPAAPTGGVFRGTTGMVGRAVRGPANKLIYCPNFSRYLDVFGARDYGINGGAIRGDLWWAFQGHSFGKCYIVRVVASDATTASFTLETAAGGGGTAVLTISAYGPGAHGNDIMWKVLAASNGVATSFNLSIQLYGVSYLFENISINGTDDNTAAVIGSDDATIIRLTKVANGRPVNSAATTDGADANGYTKLGQTVASFTSVAGSDGTIADSDYTVGGGPIEIMHNARGIDTKVVAGRSNTAIKTKLFALAPTANLSAWAIAPDTATTSISTFSTEVASLRHRAIWAVYNTPYFPDPVTTVLTAGEPHVHLAAVLSQIDYGDHPGNADTSELNQQIDHLQFELADPDRDTLDGAGITFLNRDVDVSNNNVFLFGNGKTTDLLNNNSQIDGERTKMFLIMGLAQRARGDEKKPNTKTARSKRASSFGSWFTRLAKKETYVDRDQTTLVPLYSIQNDDAVNTETDRDAGIQRDVIQVKLIPKNLILQLQVTAGVDAVVITAD